MQINEIEIKNLRSSTTRFKKEDDYKLNKLRTSMQRHGQFDLVHVVPEPITDTYEIYAGSQVIRVMKEMGLERAFCRVHDNSSELLLWVLEAESIRFEIDYYKVAEIVQTMIGKGFTSKRIQHSVPWSMEEIENMIKMKEFDWDKYGEPASEQVSLF